MQNPVLLLAALALLVAGCRSNDGPSFQEDLVGTCWVLASMDGQPIAAGPETTLCFEATGRIAGNSGCNDYFGGATFEADRLSIDRVGATRKACAPELMDREQRFFEQLGAVRRWVMDGPELLLYGEEPPALRFRRQ